MDLTTTMLNNDNVINIGRNWYALQMLRRDVKFMKDRNSEGRFDAAIEKDKVLFNQILKESIN